MYEKILVKNAQAGDRVAMETLLKSLAPRLHRFSQRLCSMHAEDAVQEALLKVAQELPQFQGEGALSSWAFTIVRSACSRLSRGKKNEATEFFEEGMVPGSESIAFDPERAVLHRERKAAFNCALLALPIDLREAVLLRDIEELSAQEAADSLHIGVSALKSRLHRGRSALSGLLEKQLAGGGAPGACPDILQAMSQKYENALAQSECALLENHLRGCNKCAAICDRLKKAIAECRSAELTEEQAQGVRNDVQSAMSSWLSTCPSRERGPP